MNNVVNAVLEGCSELEKGTKLVVYKIKKVLHTKKLTRYWDTKTARLHKQCHSIYCCLDIWLFYNPR